MITERIPWFCQCFTPALIQCLSREQRTASQRMGHPWKNLMASATIKGTRLAKGILIGLFIFEAVNNWRSCLTENQHMQDALSASKFSIILINTDALFKSRVLIALYC